jgi:hypothetical protein
VQFLDCLRSEDGGNQGGNLELIVSVLDKSRKVATGYLPWS